VRRPKEFSEVVLPEMQEALSVEVYQWTGPDILVFGKWLKVIHRHWHEGIADQEAPVRRCDIVFRMMGDHHHVAGPDMSDNCGAAVVHISED
jgi:hypothetical protein